MPHATLQASAQVPDVGDALALLLGASRAIGQV